jgi:hypothetical protein
MYLALGQLVHLPFAICHLPFVDLPLALGSHWCRIEVALGSHWGSLGVALESQWGAYRLAINTLWGGFEVALMWLWVALGRMTTSTSDH